MARALRLHVPGGYYHVTLRGNHQQPIFRTSSDRERLDALVGETVSESGARVHAYCWMTNHIHLLIQVADEPLGNLILKIASQYARQFQARLQTTGHLFERRYHAVLVDADSYLLTLVRYIHLNPVDAGLAKDPALYPWSSHRVYLGQRSLPWLHTSTTLALFSSNAGQAVTLYCRWMGQPAPEKWGNGSLAPNPNDPQVVGDDDFLRRVSTRAWKPRASITLEELLRECVDRFHTTVEELESPSRAHRLGTARAWLCHQARDGGVASISAIARRLGRSEGAIRRLMQRRPIADPEKVRMYDPAPA